MCDNSTSTCPDPVEFDFVPCSQTATGTCPCQLKGCKCWTQGAFPVLLEEKEYLRDYYYQYDEDPPIWTSNETGKQYRVLNGGVPQYANLTLHLELIKQTIDDFIPPLDYNGNLVLDFENWTPIWEGNRGGNSYHAKVYQEYSIDLLEKQHPSWTPEEISELAGRSFRLAGVRFFVATLQLLRSLRPKASIGFYGLPNGHYKSYCTPDKSRCGYDNPDLGPSLKQQNDAIAPIYQASSALFPSVYLREQSNDTFADWRHYNQKYVNDTVHESVRLVTTYSNFFSPKTTPIRSFYWAKYHDGGKDLLSAQDLAMVAKNTYLPPWSTEVVQWGFSGLIGPWQSSVGGPVMKLVVDTLDDCARLFCNNHGWCSHYPDIDSTFQTCICDAGYQGEDCSKAMQ